ncbi:MAG: S8 family serine peptidase, partial [Actinomycetota bacterium]
DYDLGLHRSSDLAVVAASVDPQTGTQPPTEFLCNTSATTAAYTVSILKFDATETPRFDLFAVHELPFEHQVPAGSIVEPASSPDAFAAGAFCWRDGSLQSYSSRGPTIDGRTKPDILGPSRVATSTYGASTHCDPGGGGFGGTSASAPHVAGAAALVKEMHPSFDADQLQAFLEAAAKDQGEPGKDNSFGAGNLFLREPLCPGRSNSSGTHFVGTNGPDTFTGTLGSDVMCGLGGNDTLRGRKGKDVLIGGGGNDRLIGGEQNDTLQGQAGADILKGQTGRDVLDGGGGTDRCLPGGANETIRGCER